MTIKISKLVRMFRTEAHVRRLYSKLSPMEKAAYEAANPSSIVATPTPTNTSLTDDTKSRPNSMENEDNDGTDDGTNTLLRKLIVR